MKLRIHYIKDKPEDLAVQNKYASTLLNNQTSRMYKFKRYNIDVSLQS